MADVPSLTGTMANLQMQELFGTVSEKRDVLDREVKAGVITNSGANFLRKALDPMHDFRVRLDGIPDTQTSDTIIQEIPLTFSFTAPTGVTGPWDLHIFTLPELWDIFAAQTTGVRRTNLIVGAGTYQTSTAPASQPFDFGLVTAVGVAAGSPTCPNGVTMGTNYYTSPFNLSPYLYGQKRPVFVGVEAHDDTAELNRQGSVVVYRMPQTNQIAGIVLNNPTIVSPLTAVISRAPPATVSEARLMTDSAEWSARDGAYVVATIDQDHNPITGGTPCTRLFTRGDLQGGTANPLTNWAFGTIPETITVNTAPALSASLCETFKPVPINTSGMYFSGLNPLSVITCTIRVGYESAPTFENSQLVVQAEPSPDYDPKSLEQYKAAATKMPPGVPSSMNASGQFWDGVLDIIEEAAPLVGSFVPGGNIASSLIAKGIKGIRSQPTKAPKTAARPERAAAGVDNVRNNNAAPARGNPKPQSKSPVPKKGKRANWEKWP
jgi:hypothetical protein